MQSPISRFTKGSVFLTGIKQPLCDCFIARQRLQVSFQLQWPDMVPMCQPYLIQQIRYR